jgi:hypothetical protein
MRRDFCQLCFSLVLVLGAACEAEPTNDYGKMDLHYPDAGLPVSDAGPDAGGDGGPGCKLVRPEACGELMPDACNTPAGSAPGAITGEIRVPAGTVPGGGHPAKGTLLIAIVPSLEGDGSCPGDPNAAPSTPFVALHCADLTAGKELPFTIPSVPAGSWFVVAGLDVNGNGVDPCDLVGLTFLPVEVKDMPVALPQTLDVGFSATQAIPASCDLSCE